MTLTTEIFTMIVFIAGFPFFYAVIRSTELPGRSFFLPAYLFMMFSNIFTVLEEFWLNSFFNFCEHASLFLSSLFMLLAIIKFTNLHSLSDNDNASPRPE